MFKITLSMLLFVFYVLVSISGESNSIVVETKNGGLKGFPFMTLEGKFVNAFLGVPYAKPPVGKLRFRDPVPVDNWEGIKEALSFGSECCQLAPQQFSTNSTGEEDCLFLNIFTPTVIGSELEVIFYIHGGAFMFGSGGTITPDYLMFRKDVVFVSVNYRLGPFGFLSSEDHVIPGNFGLKDQVVALKWVSENIEFFGGDRTKIILAGFSAGGASVHYHYFSQLSKELFSRGISQSGTVFCPWALTENSRVKFETLSTFLGCPISNVEHTLRCLQSKPAEEIINHIHNFMPWLNNPFTPFGPVIEKNTKGNAFLDEHPWQLLKNGRVKDAPWLVSVATDEGLCPAAMFVNNDTLLNDLDENWNKIAPHLLDFTYTVAQEHLNHTSQTIRSFYLGDKRVSEAKNKLIKMISDRLFILHIENSVKMQASISTNPVYFYVFAYEGRYRFSHFICNCTNNFGVSHGDDMLYLLKTVFSPSPLDSPNDKSMIDTMVNIWSNFTKNGKPGEDKYWVPNYKLLADHKNVSFTLISSSINLESKYVNSLGNQLFWDTLQFDELEKSLAVAQTRRKDEL